MKIKIFLLLLHISSFILSQDKIPVIINTNIPSDIEYELFFKNLKSINDSIALNSFFYLSNGNQKEVEPRIVRYNLNDFDHKLNGCLPLFKDRFLTQFVYLSKFCQKQNIDYIPNDTLKKIYYKLMLDLSYKDRYKYENDLINTLSLKNITTLEFWSALYDMEGPRLGNSAGRILDLFYSENWNNIVNDPVQLRIYLKKSYLYNNFGIVGSCNNYLVKFHNSNYTIYERLKNLLITEKDQDIRKQIIRILNNVYDKYDNKSLNATKNIKLKDFLKEISFYDYNLLKSVIVDSSGKDYEKIVHSINNTTNKDNIQKLINLLFINNNPRMTPYLMPLLDNNTILRESEIGWHDLSFNAKSIKFYIYIADEIVSVLEMIYNYSFPNYDKDLGIQPYISMHLSEYSNFKNKKETAENWLNLWEADRNHYLSWGNNFYKTKLSEIKEKDTISINDINFLINSKFLNVSDLDTVLSKLAKVFPKSSHSNLDLNNEHLDTTYLKYFENLDIDHDDVNNIIEKFKYGNFESIYKFIEKISKHYTLKEKGKLLEDQYYNNKFWQYILNLNNNQEKIDDIIKCLKEYKKDLKNDKLSYENAETIIFMLENINITLEDKIKKSIQYKNNNYNSLMETLLGSVDIKDLPIILKYYDSLTSDEFDDYEKLNYLNDDFGIYIDGITPDDIYELIENLKIMTENEVYHYYLNKNGIYILDIEGKLEYNKIYNILKYSINADFTSGFFRANPISLSIIKILELKYNTNLGFNGNFNNSLSHSYSDNKERINAWMNYLIQNNLVDKSLNDVPSFNYFE